jgi:hypothetical protein
MRENARKLKDVYLVIPEHGLKFAANLFEHMLARIHPGKALVLHPGGRNEHRWDIICCALLNGVLVSMFGTAREPLS